MPLAYYMQALPRLNDGFLFEQLCLPLTTFYITRDVEVLLKAAQQCSLHIVPFGAGLREVRAVCRTEVLRVCLRTSREFLPLKKSFFSKIIFGNSFELHDDL